MNEDESLYKAIIIALVIGIVIVIATLLLTKSNPETFTELYFNNHKELPNFVQENKSYDYSFVISNHEGKDVEYNYTISETLINLDYSCEDTVLYLSKQNESKYKEYVKGDYKIDTWATETKDPLLYINEENYSIKLSYQIKSGAGQIVIGLKGLDGKDNYVLIINEKEKKAHFLTANQDIEIDINESDALSRRVSIQSRDGTLIIELDSQTLVELSNVKGYSKGFLYLEMTQTYAKLWTPIIERGDLKQVINLQFGGIQFVTVPLEVTQTLQQKILFYQAPSNTANSEQNTESQNDEFPDNETILNETRKSYFYYVGNPFNMTRYTMESVFRLVNGEQFSMGVQDKFALGFFPLDYKVLFTYLNEEGENKTLNLSLPNRMRGWHSIMFDVNDNVIKVYFDSKLSAVVNDSKYGETPIPFLRTDDKRAVVQSFYAESNIEPLKYNYNIPKSGTQKRRYTRIYDPRLITRPDQPEDERTPVDDELTYVYESNRIDWDNYSANIIYVDNERKNSMLITFNDLDSVIYSLFLDDNQANFTYWKDKRKITELKNISLNTSYTHRVEFDVEENNITVRVDFEKLWELEIDKTSGGLLLLNNSENVSVKNTNIENRDSNEVRVYQKPDPKCKPLSTNTSSRTSSVYIKNEDLLKIEESFNFKKDFDIGIIEIGINEEQKIRFLVTKIWIYYK